MSLLNIAPLVERVTINGEPVECRGIAMRDIAALLSRFPTLRALVWGGRDAMSRGNATAATRAAAEALSDPMALVREIPDAIGPVIAAGTGYAGNQQAEDIAAGLPVDAQLDLLVAIFKLTMPDGIGPLAQKLGRLFETAGATEPNLTTERTPPAVGFDQGRPPQPNGVDSNSNTPRP